MAALADETYDYGEVVFLKAVLDGADVADWLAEGRGEVGGLTFTLREPTADCSWERWESRRQAHYGTLFAMPHTDYRVLSQNSTQPSWPGTVLAGAGLPFFPDVNVAAASVLFGVHSMPGGRTIPSEMMLVRIAHPEAYFEKLRVSSTSIVASVLGEDLEDVHLQVSSAGERHETPVGQPGDIHLPISGADSTDTWVALTRRQECLDFRTISSRWPDSLAQRDIVYEPEDLNERLDLIRLGGENETVEFKEAVPKGDRIAKAVAAFANGRGGTIIVGIRDGTGEVTGIMGDVTAARDRLDNIVRSGVDPPPEYELSTCTLAGRTVIAMRVAPGDQRPYGAVVKGGIRYYVRRGANNWVAQPEEVRVIACPRQSDDQEPFLQWE